MLSIDHIRYCLSFFRESMLSLFQVKTAVQTATSLSQTYQTNFSKKQDSVHYQELSRIQSMDWLCGWSRGKIELHPPSLGNICKRGVGAINNMHVHIAYLPSKMHISISMCIELEMHNQTHHHCKTPLISVAQKLPERFLRYWDPNPISQSE